MAHVSGEDSFPTLFHEGAVVLGLEAADKKQVLARLVDALVASGSIGEPQRASLLGALVAREGLGSTGIGSGIAIPHVKVDQLDAPAGTVAAIGVSRRPIDFKAVDGEPCDLFFLLVSAKDHADNHLKILRWLSKLVRNTDFCRFMRGTRDPAEAVSLLKEMG